MLITIEGIDGSGKSTLFAGLKNRLVDLNPVFTKEPGSSLVNTSLRKEIAQNRDPLAEATLFVADHAAHLTEVVIPALKDNRLVISDRYTDSRFVYQELTLTGVIDHPYEWLQRVHSGWTIVPDITFYLSIDPTIAIERIRQRGGNLEHFETIEFLTKVHEGFTNHFKHDYNRHIMFVDASMYHETVLETVETIIREQINSLENI